METFYTQERNTQILIGLMKAHGIKKIVASPGATNVCFIASVQQDPYFEIYSSVDERSAAYIACGLAEESGEAVALSCTGATASRNYIPGMTEAYYRKLPVLAITSTQRIGRIGHNVPQVIDRTTPLNDIVKVSVQAQLVKDKEDEWNCNTLINKAILELFRNGGGPAHINLETDYSDDYSVKTLPEAKVINRVNRESDNWPDLTGKRVAIFVGAHTKWSDELTRAVDDFCGTYDAVVVCDHTSNYKGKYSVLANIVTSQSQYYSKCRNMDVMIHIGNISGAYIYLNSNEVWRVNPDGDVCDTFGKLKYTFEMDELAFFKSYAKEGKNKNNYYNEWKDEISRLESKIPELPFSNLWIAQQTIKKIPSESVLHLGILNSLRSWNFFEANPELLIYSNTGGFGIDGCISSLIGASLANTEKKYFGVVGDLAFFYDMNSLGNRHIGNNVRLMVINNGRGMEFRNYNHKAAKFGEDADTYMAAAGHYGNKSQTLIKNYVESLGFEYLKASNKDEYSNNVERFTAAENLDKPIVFEIFTNAEEESDALKIMNNLEVQSLTASGKAKKLAKNIVGEKGVESLKKIIKR